MRRREIGVLVARLSYISKHIDHSLTYSGQPVQKQHVFSDACLSWLAWACEALPGTTSLSWAIQLFYKLHTCDVFLLGNWMKSVALAIRNTRDQQTLPFELFKGVHLGGTLYSGHILVPLIRLEDRCSVSSIRLSLSYLEFMSRVSLKLPCEEQQVRDYRANEQRLKDLVLDREVVRSLNQILLDWFPGVLELDDPRHGPGAVAAVQGRPCKMTKYNHLASDPLLEYGLRSTDAYTHLSSLSEERLERVSDLLFVPKSLTTYRTICKEPTSLQFWQQAVCKSMVREMKKVLRFQVDLSDQTVSVRAAQKASRTRQFATIDLSNASDSVSTRLVQGVFANTSLLRPLMITRSRHVRLPDKELLALEKFAPMGSAVCFPTQCIVFSAICEMGYRLAGRKRRDYTVYGDDIICHRTCVPYVLDLLSRCGFLVNRHKSFIATDIPFRESCGGEYWNGHDVSPLRISRWFAGLQLGDIRRSPQRYVDFANDLFKHGVSGLRSLLVSKLLQLRCPPPFSYTGVGLWSHQPTNFHLRRVSAPTGEKALRHGGCLSRELRTPSHAEIIRYLDWFLTYRGLETYEICGSHHIGKVEISWGWAVTPMWQLAM